MGAAEGGGAVAVASGVLGGASAGAELVGGAFAEAAPGPSSGAVSTAAPRIEGVGEGPLTDGPPGLAAQATSIRKSRKGRRQRIAYLSFQEGPWGQAPQRQ